MEKKRKKNILFFGIIFAVAAVLVILPFALEASGEKSGAESSHIHQGTPERITIEKNLSGTGTLTAEEAEKVKIPAEVEVTEYLVSNHESVKAGTRLASVDKSTVMMAMTKVSEKLASIEEEMDGLRNWLSYKDESGTWTEDGKSTSFSFRIYTAQTDEDLHKYLYSPVDGTVAAMYAKQGDDARETVLRYGCLAVISFDNGYEYKVTAVNGDIAHIYYREGETVKAGAALFYLENCTNDAQIEVLASQHREYEEIMETLVKLYKDGYVAAPCDGVISGIDEEKATALEVKARKAHVIQADILAFDTASAPGSAQTASISGTVAEIQGDGTVVISTQNGDVPVSNFEELFASEDGYEIGTKVQLQYSYKFENGEMKFVLSQITAANAPGSREDDSGSGGQQSQQTQQSQQSQGSGNAEMKTGPDSENASDYPTTQTEIMSVVPQHELTVSVTIDELDILYIHAGMETQVTIDAFPGRAYRGTITGINTVGSNNGGNSKYTAEITIPREETMIEGMNASVLINVETTENILAVPVKAIYEEGTKSVLYREYDEENREFLNPVEIETGISDGEYAEILSGVAENEAFYYEYNDSIDIESFMRPGGGGGIGSLFGGGMPGSGMPGGGMPGGFGSGGPGGRPGRT